jgi:hypothetical protein
MATTPGKNITTAIDISSSSTSTSSNQQQMIVFVMGEFGLLESQLTPMIKEALNSNWTISAIHNHMVLEKSCR